MHSDITDELEPAWKALREGNEQEALDVAQSTLDRIADEDFDDEEDEEESQVEPSERPPEYWDAHLVKLMVQLQREEVGESWDTIEALLPCQDTDFRPLAVGMARLGEGLLIRRMDEHGSQQDSQNSLERAAQELEDRVLTFQGDLRDDADVRDVFLAALATILGEGDWGNMKTLVDRLNDESDLSEDEEKLKTASKEILELEQFCTPEKIEEVKETGLPEHYQVFLELLEWGGSDLEDL